MSWLNVLGIAVGLGADAFAVAVAAGLSLPLVTGGHVFRLAWHFGLFQFLMPLLGWAVGSQLSDRLAAVGPWLAFGILTVLGVKMIWEAARGLPGQEKADPTRGVMLVTLSIATSIDALAVGFSLACLKVSIWGPAVVIGLVAGMMTLVGIRFGRRLGARWENRADYAGGIVLILIGLRILLS